MLFKGIPAFEFKFWGETIHYFLQFILDKTHHNAYAYRFANVVLQSAIQIRSVADRQSISTPWLYQNSSGTNRTRAGGSLYSSPEFEKNKHTKIINNFREYPSYIAITVEAIELYGLDANVAESIPFYGKAILNLNSFDFYAFLLQEGTIGLSSVSDLKFINKIIGTYPIIGRRLVKQYIHLLKEGEITTSDKKMLWECSKHTKSLDRQTVKIYTHLKRIGFERALHAQAKHIIDGLCGRFELTSEERSVPYFRDLKEFVYSIRRDTALPEADLIFPDNSDDLKYFKVRETYPITDVVRQKLAINSDMAQLSLYFADQTQLSEVINKNESIRKVLLNKTTPLEARTILIQLHNELFQEVNKQVYAFNTSQTKAQQIEIIFELSLLYEVQLKRCLYLTVENFLQKDFNDFSLQIISRFVKHSKKSFKISSRFLKYINQTYSRQTGYHYSRWDMNVIEQAFNTGETQSLKPYQCEIYKLINMRDVQNYHEIPSDYTSYVKYLFVELLYSIFLKDYEEIEKIKDHLVQKRKKKISAYITKRPETAHARFSAGLCVYQDKYAVQDPKNLWNQKHFLQLVLQDKTTGRCVGVVLIHYYEERQGKVLSVAINPTYVYRYSFSDDEILDAILHAIKTFAQDNSIRYIVVSRDRNIRTNRAGGSFEVALMKRINKYRQTFRFDDLKYLSPSSMIPFKDMDIIWDSKRPI